LLNETYIDLSLWTVSV